MNSLYPVAKTKKQPRLPPKIKKTLQIPVHSSTHTPSTPNHNNRSRRLLQGLHHHPKPKPKRVHQRKRDLLQRMRASSMELRTSVTWTRRANSSSRGGLSKQFLGLYYASRCQGFDGCDGLIIRYSLIFVYSLMSSLMFQSEICPTTCPRHYKPVCDSEGLDRRRNKRKSELQEQHFRICAHFK
jgi:hypothetical protein